LRSARQISGPGQKSRGEKYIQTSIAICNLHHLSKIVIRRVQEGSILLTFQKVNSYFANKFRMVEKLLNFHNHHGGHGARVRCLVPHQSDA
jgi:hypothetical protein